MLVLKTSDDPEDQIAISASVLLYFHVDCQELLYVFDCDSDLDSKQQRLDMVRTVTHGLLTSRSPKKPTSAAVEASMELVFDDDRMRGVD